MFFTYFLCPSSLDVAQVRGHEARGRLPPPTINSVPSLLAREDFILFLDFPRRLASNCLSLYSTYIYIYNTYYTTVSMIITLYFE